MNQKQRNAGQKDEVGFDAYANTCVEPLSVIKCEPADDDGSEIKPLGAFFDAAIEIMVDVDLEGGDDDGSSTC